MPNIDWSEGVPPTTESAGLGAQRIQSLKTAIRTGLDGEHVWPSAGGDAGVHRLGSARAYYGPQSLVSSTGTDGRLMVASDTSRLFHVGSAGTMLLGGAGSVSMNSSPGGARFYWAMEAGVARTVGVGGAVGVVIPNSGYSGVPFVTCTAEDGSQAGLHANIFGPPSTTQINITTFTKLGSVVSAVTVHWMSLGTRTL